MQSNLSVFFHLRLLVLNHAQQIFKICYSRLYNYSPVLYPSTFNGLILNLYIWNIIYAYVKQRSSIIFLHMVSQLSLYNLLNNTSVSYCFLRLYLHIHLDLLLGSLFLSTNIFVYFSCFFKSLKLYSHLKSGQVLMYTSSVSKSFVRSVNEC